jgi:hypothetical protein
MHALMRRLKHAADEGGRGGLRETGSRAQRPLGLRSAPRRMPRCFSPHGKLGYRAALVASELSVDAHAQIRRGPCSARCTRVCTVSRREIGVRRSAANLLVTNVRPETARRPCVRARRCAGVSVISVGARGRTRPSRRRLRRASRHANRSCHYSLTPSRTPFWAPRRSQHGRLGKLRASSDHLAGRAGQTDFYRTCRLGGLCSLHTALVVGVQ